MLPRNCAVSASCTSIGSACELMNTERSVWFGYVGTLTAVIFRLTVFFEPTVVVVFFTTRVSWSLPQRSTCSVGPVTVFEVVTTFGFDAAEAVGTAMAAVARTAPSCRRRVRSPFDSERKALGVDETARHAGGAHVPDCEIRHRRRAADEDVAFGDVGNELFEMGGREEPRAVGRRVVADDVVEVEAAPRGERFELVAEDNVRLVHDAVEDDRVRVELLGERAHRCDPDAARDQERLHAAACVAGEDAERAFGDDARSGLQLAEGRRVVAERLARDAERAPVRCARKREGMRGQCATAGEEARSRRLTITTEEATTAISRPVPIVAVIIPG